MHRLLKIALAFLLVFSASNAWAVLFGKPVEADKSAASFMVGVVKFNEETNKVNSENMCAGSLIAKNTVLTAGHCLKSNPTHIVFAQDILDPQSERRKILASIKRSSVSAWDAVLPSVVRSFVKRPDYDIAIVAFEGPTPEGFESIAMVAPSYTVTKESELYAAGYGINDIADWLQSMGTAHYARILAAGWFSALMSKIWSPYLKKEDVPSPCHGDSGGPLWVKRKAKGNDSLFLVGVTVGVSKTCLHGEAMYESVAFHRWWIWNKLAALQKKARKSGNQ